jgi:hypothetical protein
VYRSSIRVRRPPSAAHVEQGVMQNIGISDDRRPLARAEAVIE